MRQSDGFISRPPESDDIEQVARGIKVPSNWDYCIFCPPLQSVNCTFDCIVAMHATQCTAA